MLLNHCGNDIREDTKLFSLGAAISWLAPSSTAYHQINAESYFLLMSTTRKRQTSSQTVNLAAYARVPSDDNLTLAVHLD